MVKKTVKKAAKKIPMATGAAHARAHAQDDYEVLERAKEIQSSTARMKGVKAYAAKMEGTTAMSRIGQKKRAVPKKKATRKRN